jgi:hypothetical protein
MITNSLTHNYPLKMLTQTRAVGKNGQYAVYQSQYLATEIAANGAIPRGPVT